MISVVAAAALAILQSATQEFSQGVEYRIEARLDEEAQVLRGRGELRYTNNAPTALDTLWLHQHLNAFRPNSAWARRDLEFGERRFQDLGPDEHAFERLSIVTVDGERIQPVYPLSPDSTVVAFPLPRSLESGQTAVVRFDWEARPSTIPRRQGRSGRHYDFAQWYPRIAVYDTEGWHVQPLLPQGEFFGEFATYDVTLDVASDQVIGATGVPVEGDPGWSAAGATNEIDYQRDFYGPAEPTPLGLLADPVEPGRKRVRWRAEQVHHFAWSANPDFRYEGGTVARSGAEGGEIAVHVLYWPTDQTWANGVVLERTIRTMEWLQEMFGPYPWPQITNLHRIESGGTEFPMLMMNGSPSEGLIVHEGTHQYLHGILANNEFAEGWLDEGFASFITNWYHEERGVSGVWDNSINTMRQVEQLGLSEPIATPAAEFSDYDRYSLMTYLKTELVLRMLRWLIGEDAMRAVLRTFYERHALQHIDETDFRQVVDDVTGEEYGWFFDQWLHTTETLDYAIASASTRQDGDGWLTTVEVRRSGGAWMPVDLRVGDEGVRLYSQDSVTVAEVRTPQRPSAVVLDPENILIDVNPTNNRYLLGQP